MDSSSTEQSGDHEIFQADVDFADLCFNAEQAAEKAVEAVFIHRGETFPHTHDLQHLIRLLKGNGQKVPKYVHEAKELTRFAVLTRYPGLGSPITQPPIWPRRPYRVRRAAMGGAADWRLRQRVLSTEY